MSAQALSPASIDGSDRLHIPVVRGVPEALASDSARRRYCCRCFTYGSIPFKITILALAIIGLAGFISCSASMSVKSLPMEFDFILRIGGFMLLGVSTLATGIIFQCTPRATVGADR